MHHFKQSLVYIGIEFSYCLHFCDSTFSDVLIVLFSLYYLAVNCSFWGFSQTELGISDILQPKQRANCKKGCFNN